jgi:hypothetical protein
VTVIPYRQNTVSLDDPQVPLNTIGEVPDTRPPSGQTSGGLRPEASGPESGKQPTGSKDRTFITPLSSSPDSAPKPKSDKNRKAAPPLSSSPNPALEPKLEKGKGRSQSPNNHKEEPLTRETMFHPKLPTGAGPSEPLNGHTSESAILAAPPTVIGSSQTDGEHLSEAARIPAPPAAAGPSEPREPSGPARIPPPPVVARPSEPRGRRRPAPVAAPPVRLTGSVVALRPFTPPFASVPASDSPPENLEPKKRAPKLTKEQSLSQKYDDNVSLRTMSPPSNPLVRDAATAPVSAERLSVPGTGTRAQGSAAVSEDGSSRPVQDAATTPVPGERLSAPGTDTPAQGSAAVSEDRSSRRRPVRAGASDSARNRSPGPRPARANAAAPKPDRIPVPASVRNSPYLVVDGKPRPRYTMHGALPPQIPAPPTEPGPSHWYERLLPKSGNTPSRGSKAPPPPPTRKDKERAPPSPSGSDEYMYFPPSGPGTPLSIDSTAEPWVNVWKNSAFNTPEGTLRGAAARPPMDGAASDSGLSSSHSSDASFHTPPSGHGKRDLLVGRAERMVTASPCKSSPPSPPPPASTKLCTD